MKANSWRGALLLAGLGLVAACSQKNAEKCTQALSTARQSLEARNTELATQWRNYGYKYCEDTAPLSELDQAIVAKQQSLAAEAQAQQTKQAQHQQLVSLLRQWVGQFRAHPEQSAGNITCEHEEDAKLKASKERFCEGSRAVTGMQGAALSVRYWEKTPQDVALFRARVQLPVDCSALGGHRVLRESSIPASDGRPVKRAYCELTEGALAGLQSQATQAANSDLRIFTPKYPDQDPVLKFQLQ